MVFSLKIGVDAPDQYLLDKFGIDLRNLTQPICVFADTNNTDPNQSAADLVVSFDDDNAFVNFYFDVASSPKTVVFRNFLHLVINHGVLDKQKFQFVALTKETAREQYALSNAYLVPDTDELRYIVASFRKLVISGDATQLSK